MLRKSREDSVEPRKPLIPSLKRNFSWTALGNVIYAGCQWGVITVLAKLGTPVMVGQFALALAVTTPIIQFLNLQLRAVQATDAKQDFQFPDYLALRCVTTSLAAVLMVAVGYVWFGFDTGMVILFVALAKCLDAFSDVYFGLFQRHERMEFISKALILNGALSVLIVAGIVWVTDSLVAGAAGFACASLIPLIVYVLPVGRQLLRESTRWNQITDPFSKWKTDSLRRLVILALPLGLVMLLVSLTSNVPRYFIEHHLGEYELGIYAALAYLIVAGTTVVTALGQAVSPRLAQYFWNGQLDAFRSLLQKLLAFGLALGCAGSLVAWILGEEVITLLYTAEYAEYKSVLIILALGAGITFAASFAGFGLTAARYFRVQVPISTGALITAIVAAALLLPRHGLIGAAVGVMVTSAVQLLLSLTVVLRALRKREANAS